MTNIDKELYITSLDVNKKVYEIEYESTFITKWQILAKDKDHANTIWLDNYKQIFKTENTSNCVCSSIKEYNSIKDTNEIGTITYDQENDETYAL